MDAMGGATTRTNRTNRTNGSNGGATDGANDGVAIAAMSGAMIALLVVRDGVLPSGGDEVVAECAGRTVLIGSDTRAALDALAGIATDVRLVERADFRPGAWAVGLATLLADEPVVL
ncbi:MAG: hypothetical protein ABIR68_03790, partial [Ilumatobacteraceae bacterium]